MKLNLGAGDSEFQGFTSVDLYDPKADVQADICELPFDNDSVEEIVAFQVVEHIPYQKSGQMFGEMYRVLKSGGTAVIETPDIDYIAQDILKNGLTDVWIHSLVGEYYRPWDKDRYPDWENVAAAIHRNPWNYKRLEEICIPLGFTLERYDRKHIDVPENMCVKLRKG